MSLLYPTDFVKNYKKKMVKISVLIIFQGIGLKNVRRDQ